MDRIDIHITVPSVKFKDLSSNTKGEPSAAIRKRINLARELQIERFKDEPTMFCNAHMESRQIREHCEINSDGENILKMAVQKLGLSARAYDRILKVSRTIADMEGVRDILPGHLCEAIQYRALDRRYVN